jgi:hypothetical protein
MPTVFLRYLSLTDYWMLDLLETIARAYSLYLSKGTVAVVTGVITML